MILGDRMAVFEIDFIFQKEGTLTRHVKVGMKIGTIVAIGLSMNSLI